MIWNPALRELIVPRVVLQAGYRELNPGLILSLQPDDLRRTMIRFESAKRPIPNVRLGLTATKQVPQT